MERRPLTLEDAQSVYDVIAASELAETGEVSIEVADIVADWQTPGFEVSASTLGIFDSAGLIAFAEHSGQDRGHLDVHPRGRVARGRDPLLAEVADWLVRRAASTGAPEVGLPVPRGAYRDLQLVELGWQERWTSWVLRLPEGVAVADRPVPAGYTVGEAAAHEYAVMHEVIEDAFLEWSVRRRAAFEEFAAHTVQRSGFQPWLMRVVRDEQQTVVAAAVCVLYDGETYVDKLATRADRRGRGLAQALLADCFTAGRARGGPRAGLSTDSRTGALDLYLKVGMEVVATWVNRGQSTRSG